MKESRVFRIFREKGVGLVSACCAALMLCVVPLIFRNAFFDINRIKVYAVYGGVPAMLVLMLLAVLADRKREDIRLPDRDVLLCFGAMGAFLIACLLSCFATGFDPAALLGNKGRYCGLLFFVCCGLAFYMIAGGSLSSRRLLPVIEICAAAIALLGVVNVMGVDPLGFYQRIRKDQISTFMSTIGHFDFFGTYLVLLFPLASGSFVFSKRTSSRVIGGVGAVLMAMGAAASRTDSALFGVHLGCIALLALSGGSYKLMMRACIVWAACFLLLPLVGAMLDYSAFDVAFAGPLAMLCDTHIALLAGVLLLLAAVVCHLLAQRRMRAPGRKAMVIAAIAVLAAAALILIGMIVYFTVFHVEADLGAAKKFLRFDDEWGSYRGFVYQRAMDAFSKYSLAEKLFGRGLDTTRLILAEYFDHPVVSIVGVFDDVHCQPLQLLLTGGLLCAGAFIAFYLISLVTLLRHAGVDPLLCGTTASVFAYSIVMLLNVTQPILIATYFSLCGLGLSRIGYIARRRRNGR